MLPKPADALPEGDGWLFEPKWDGFRALVFRDGAETLNPVADLKPLDSLLSGARCAAPGLAAGQVRGRRRGRDRPARPGLEFESLRSAPRHGGRVTHRHADACAGHRSR